MSRLTTLQMNSNILLPVWIYNLNKKTQSRIAPVISFSSDFSFFLSQKH